jgi:hypothetical protein
MLPTSIIKMNEECTSQNPQNCYLVLNKMCNLNFFLRVPKFMMMGECTPNTNKFSNTSKKIMGIASLFQWVKISEPLSSSSLLMFTLATIFHKKLMKLVGSSCSHMRFKWKIVIAFYIVTWKICLTFFGSSHWCIRNMCF